MAASVSNNILYSAKLKFTPSSSSDSARTTTLTGLNIAVTRPEDPNSDMSRLAGMTERFRPFFNKFTHGSYFIDTVSKTQAVVYE